MTFKVNRTRSSDAPSPIETPSSLEDLSTEMCTFSNATLERSRTFASSGSEIASPSGNISAPGGMSLSTSSGAIISSFRLGSRGRYGSTLLGPRSTTTVPTDASKNLRICSAE